MKAKKKTKRERLFEMNLDLFRVFLLEVVRDPQRVAHVPNDSTLILYPVQFKRPKAA